jgi:hypothetical protein
MKLAVATHPFRQAKPAVPAVQPAVVKHLIILQNSRYGRYSRFIKTRHYQLKPSTSAHTYRGELNQHAVAAVPAVIERIQIDMSSRLPALLPEPAARELVLTAAPHSKHVSRFLKLAAMCRGPPSNSRTL